MSPTRMITFTVEKSFLTPYRVRKYAGPVGTPPVEVDSFGSLADAKAKALELAKAEGGDLVPDGTPVGHTLYMVSVVTSGN